MSDEGVNMGEVKKITDALIKEGIGFKRYCFPGGFQSAGFLKNSKPGEVIIGAGETVIELGHPVTASICAAIITDRAGIVADGQVTVVGDELQKLPKGRYSVALLVLAEVAEANESSRQAVARKISSCDSIAGCMARVLQDKIWFRFSKDALNNGLSLGIIGGHLISEIKKEKDKVKKVEVIFVVAEEKKCINWFRPVVDRLTESRIAHYKDLYDKREDCDSGLDCRECPDSTICSVFKEAVLISRKKERTS